MSKLRLLYLFLALSLVLSPVFPQGPYNSGSSSRTGWLSGQMPDKNTRFSLEVGTGFTSVASGTSMFSNYFSSRLEYDLSPSFTIITGGSFALNQYNNLPQSLVVNSNSTPAQQGLADHALFMSGRYMINENLFMTGTVYREQGHLPMLLMNRGSMDYSSQGMSMGIEYRVNDNIQFGAEVGVNRSNNPYHHYSPFSDPFNYRSGRSRNRFSPF